MRRSKIKALFQSGTVDSEVLIKGWIRTKRDSKNVVFIAVNDGSCIHNMQAVLDVAKFDEELLQALTTGTSVAVSGKLVKSMGKGQSVEILTEHVEIYGKADPETYPLQPKRHSMEFLREIAHLRPRSNVFGVIFRIRHALAFAIHPVFLMKRIRVSAIHPSLPVLIVKEQVRCSGFLHWILQILPEPKTDR